MNNLVVKGEQINSYMLSVLKLINEYIEEIDTMLLYKNDVVWDSDNKDIFMETLEKNLNDHYLKIKKMYNIVSSLNNYLSDYNDCIEDIKSNFDKLDNKFNKGGSNG